MDCIYELYSIIWNKHRHYFEIEVKHCKWILILPIIDVLYYGMVQCVCKLQSHLKTNILMIIFDFRESAGRILLEPFFSYEWLI